MAYYGQCNLVVLDVEMRNALPLTLKIAVGRTMKNQQNGPDRSNGSCLAHKCVDVLFKGCWGLAVGG